MKLTTPDLWTVLDIISKKPANMQLELLSIMTAAFAEEITPMAVFGRSTFSDDAELFGLIGSIMTFCKPKDYFLMCKMLSLHLYADIDMRTIIETLKETGEY